MTGPYPLGWVEVRINKRWYGVIEASHILWKKNFDVFEKLFGLYGHEDEAVAPYRGIPRDASFEVKEHPLIDELTAFGHTWISYRELKENEEILTEDWKLLLKMMDALAEHYGEENVRLVIWFDE